MTDVGRLLKNSGDIILPIVLESHRERAYACLGHGSNISVTPEFLLRLLDKAHAMNALQRNWPAWKLSEV